MRSYDEAREDVAQHHRLTQALEEDRGDRRDTKDGGEGLKERVGVVHGGASGGDGLSLTGPARAARGRIHWKLGRTQPHRSRATAPTMMSRHSSPLHNRR